MKVLISALILLLTGCASLPEVLQVENEEGLVPYSQVLHEQVISQQQTARWSGRIASVSNGEAHSVIEVVYQDLDQRGLPVDAETSPGRFRAVMDGFIDPQVYAQGRTITLVGRPDKAELGKIGDYSYSFPVLRVRTHYLWPKVKDVQIPYAPGWHRDPFYSPWYHDTWNVNEPIDIPYD